MVVVVCISARSRVAPDLIYKTLVSVTRRFITSFANEKDRKARRKESISRAHTHTDNTTFDLFCACSVECSGGVKVKPTALAQAWWRWWGSWAVVCTVCAFVERFLQAGYAIHASRKNPLPTTSSSSPPAPCYLQARTAAGGRVGGCEV